jgi:hypothetical protein
MATLWNVPMRSSSFRGPPARIVSMSAFAALRREDAPFRRHLDAARSRKPVEERRADCALERGDLPADRRLGVAERRGGRAERALARDRLQRNEVPKLDPMP